MTRPRLQIALDLTDLPSALAPLQRAAPEIDIIECGTVLVLAEGLRAVREIRALFPGQGDPGRHADRRGREAAFADGLRGRGVARLGGGRRLDEHLQQVCAVAAAHHGEVQVELSDEWYDAAKARQWREAGAQHVIVKRSRDREAAGDLSWGPDDVARVDELAAMGFTVTITGGVTPADLATFANHPVGIVIAGRSIVAAKDPLAAAAELKQAIARVWPS